MQKDANGNTLSVPAQCASEACPIEEQQKEKEKNIFIIIGAVVAAVILVAIIAIIFAICRKNNKKDDKITPFMVSSNLSTSTQCQ